jgi:hypothetical protein
LGARGRGFKSLHPDDSSNGLSPTLLHLLETVTRVGIEG